MIQSIIALILFLASAFFSVVSHSLRNFLRSRLALICRTYKNEFRFGEILREDEHALQTCEGLQIATLVLGVMVGSVARYAGIEVTTLSLATDLICFVAIGWFLFVVFAWSLSRVAAEHVLFRCWPLIHLLTVGTGPVRRLTNQFDTLMHRIAGRQDPVPENLETFTEEIQSVVDEGEREGILESRAGKMIHRVMELRQEDVRAVMTPRTDILSIPADSSLEQTREALIRFGHSRVPVVDGSPDDILGILYARDLLEHIAPGAPNLSLREIVRTPFYVPETTTINSLLERMKRERLHMAIVLDEYGGVTGLVTLEDILEEIVGDIADEFDEHEDDQVKRVNEHTLQVDARTHLDELNDTFDLEFPEDRDFDTIGGFVFSELGRVPEKGERFIWNNIQITVIEATDRKITTLELFSSVPWAASDSVPPESREAGRGMEPVRMELLADSQEESPPSAVP